MVFKFRAVRAGAHIELTAFCGVDRDHYQSLGTLRFMPDEYKAFVFRIVGVRGLMNVDEFTTTEIEYEVAK